MSGIIISNGNPASAEAVVNSDGAMSVNLPRTLSASPGFASLMSEIDGGGVLGSRYLKALEVSEDYRLRVGMDTPLFNISFEGSTIAQGHIQQNLTTMTVAQASTVLSLNSGNATASGNAAHVKTYRNFPMFGTVPTYGEFLIREANPEATNAVSEWGFGIVSGATAQASDGAFFRRLSGGSLRAVVVNTGTDIHAVDITEAAIPSRDGSGTYDPTELNHYVVSVNTDEVTYWINDVLVCRIALASTAPMAYGSSEQPLFARVYNSGVASAGRRVELGLLNVSLGDINMGGKPWGHTLSGMGNGAYQAQIGQTSGQTSTYANGAAAGAGTWTASTAPATNSLGGLWTSPATLAAGAESDFPIFAYLNPAGSNAAPGKTLYVTGIRIGETIVTTALGANPAALCWGCAAGSTASSLATTDAAATVGPRRIALGTQFLPASAVAFTGSSGLQVDFGDSPLIVPPGTYFHVIMRILNNTAAGALRGSVAVLGYFE